jgi:AraC family transcriptional activator of mtrCDE
MPRSFEYMSKTVNYEGSGGDPLSELLRQLRFSATVYLRSDFCGLWAVDTSGGRQVPFHLVTHGEGWLHVEGQEPEQLLPGHLVLFPADSAHVLASTPTLPSKAIINQAASVVIDGPVTRLVCGFFRFDRRAADPLLSSLPATMLLNLSDAPTSSARDLVQLWMREAADDQLGSNLAIDRYAELIFIQMLRTEMAAGRLQGVIGALADARLGPSLAAIHQAPGEAHRLIDLADQAGMSESAYSQRFKRLVGMTPGNYIKHWRMQLAQRALAETDRSIADIADTSGYESEVSFRKAFSSYVGTAPARYRREA